jgi:ribonuclease Z
MSEVVEVLFLGTGGSVPTPERNTLAVAIRHGSEMLLFDCGEGTQRQFMRSAFSFMKLDRIFISHLHGDHFLGLFGLVQSMNFSGRERPLEIFGPRGIGDVVQTCIMSGHFELKFPIYWRELGSGEMVRGKDYSVLSIGAIHGVPSLSFVLQEDERQGRFDKQRALDLGVPPGPLFSQLQSGQDVRVDGVTIAPKMVLGPPRPGLKIAYSGDTLPNQMLAQAAEDCDMMIHEATVESSLEAKANEYGHSTAAQAAMIALSARARSLYMVHISGRYDDPAPLLDEARKIFPNSFLPNDLELVEIKK